MIDINGWVIRIGTAVPHGVKIIIVPSGIIHKCALVWNKYFYKFMVCCYHSYLFTHLFSLPFPLLSFSFPHTSVRLSPVGPGSEGMGFDAIIICGSPGTTWSGAAQKEMIRREKR
jgi:hypothetical protein